MISDPGQTKDVTIDHPSEAAEFKAAVNKWRTELLPGLKNDRRPFPVGHKAFPTTFLPARDGVPHGNVRRSARAPNCSFFTNWIDTKDRITWDVEVATAGQYEVTLFYTCAPENVGSVIELSFADSRVESTITDAHDPPLRGAENDRVSRESESYVKDFKPLTLGRFNLSAARNELTLRALKVAGKQVVDVRALQLTLVQ
jgi:hypothetical protein